MSTEPRMAEDELIRLGYQLVAERYGNPEIGEMDRLDIDGKLDRYFGGGLVCLGLIVNRLLDLDLVVQCNASGCGELLEASYDVELCDRHEAEDVHRNCRDGHHIGDNGQWLGQCRPVTCRHVVFPSTLPCGFSCEVWDAIKEDFFG